MPAGIRLGVAFVIAALVLGAPGARATEPDGPVHPASPRPSFRSLLPPEPGDPGNAGHRPAGAPRVEPGNARAVPTPTEETGAPPTPGSAGGGPVDPPRPNPATEALRDRQDRGRCATGEIVRDRHGKPCP